MLAAQDVLVKSIRLSFSIHTFIITFLQYIHPSPFAEASHQFPHLLKPPLGAQKVEFSPALQQARELQTV
jgi:hypothetical protein